MSLFVLVVLGGAVVAVLAFSQRRRRLVAGATWTIAALAVLWLADLAAVSQGWRDLDGFVDCNDSCSAGQTAAGVVLIWVPILVFLLVGILVFARYRPAQRDRPPDA